MGEVLGLWIEVQARILTLVPDPNTFLNHPTNDQLATVAHSF